MARNVSPSKPAGSKTARPRASRKPTPLTPPQWPEPVFPSSRDEEALAEYLAKANMCEHLDLARKTRFFRWTWNGATIAETRPGGMNDASSTIWYYQDGMVHHSTPAAATPYIIARARDIRAILEVAHERACYLHEVAVVRAIHGKNPYW